MKNRTDFGGDLISGLDPGITLALSASERIVWTTTKVNVKS